MICMDATTMRRYRAVKRYAANGAFTERQTGRRYNVVKVWF